MHVILALASLLGCGSGETPPVSPPTPSAPTVATAPTPPPAAPPPVPEPAVTPEVGVDADESAPISEDELVAARARQMRAELDLLGKPAPTLSVSRWIQGTGNLGSAKVTLLVFFEAEDSDRDALAIVEALWRRHRDAGLAVIGLTRESDLHPAPTISAWLRRVAITFPVGLDAEGATAEAWRRSSTLSGALVREGRVAWTGNPARVTDALLADHL